MKTKLFLLILASAFFFVPLSTKAQTLETDSLALLSLYLDTDGALWLNNNNWLSNNPLATWHGITVSGNRVTQIDLSDNNLNGEILSGFDNLNVLNVLKLNGNSISGIASLSSMTSLNNIDLSDNLLKSLPATGSSVILEFICHSNQLDFGDLEPLVGLVVGNFQYSPQANIGEERFQYYSLNTTIHLAVEVDGLANLYFWLKDNQPVNPSPSTIPDLSISNAIESDEGIYIVEITNPQLPALTMQSNPIHLRHYLIDNLGGEYVPNQLIIEFTEDATQFERDTMLEYYDAVRLEICLCGIIELWELPDTSITPQGQVIIGVEGVKENAISKAKVEDADKNYIMKLLDSDSGNTTFEPEYAFENFNPANVAVLDDVIPIALIDVGIDTTLSIIYPWLWINEAEALDGEDNDGNCLDDDTKGFNFVDSHNAPMDAIHGHGTHLAGIITNGLPNDIQVMNIKTHDDDGLGLLFEATCAIYYAFQKEAKVINLSWGYRGEPVAVLENAIARAGENCGSLIVASAGNETLDNDSFPHYPSGYELDNIISVAALNFEESNLLEESNFGIQSVDIAAPGDSIFSTLPNPLDFGYKSGTSMAAAAVSRAAALLIKENPEATYLNVIDAILSTAESVPTLNNIASGGKLDLDAALDYILTVEPDTNCLMTVGLAAELPNQFLTYNVYPQPFYEQVTIDIDIEKFASAEFLVVDVIGKPVYHKHFDLDPLNNQLQWDGRSKNGTELPNGLYFASLQIEDQFIGFQLLKMK